MITAIDSNVLIDVLIADTTFGESSRVALGDVKEEGRIIACDIVWAEVLSISDDTDAIGAALDELGLDFVPLDRLGSARAAKAWRSYRAKGGSRTRLIPDFLIGAHAEENADRLLTRDRGFYRNYFDSLKIIDPAR